MLLVPLLPINVDPLGLRLGLIEPGIRMLDVKVPLEGIAEVVGAVVLVPSAVVVVIVHGAIVAAHVAGFVHVVNFAGHVPIIEPEVRALESGLGDISVSVNYGAVIFVVLVYLVPIHDHAASLVSRFYPVDSGVDTIAAFV